QPPESEEPANAYEPEQEHLAEVNRQDVYEASSADSSERPREEIKDDTYDDLTILDQYETVMDSDQEDNDDFAEKSPEDQNAVVEEPEHAEDIVEDMAEDRDKELKVAFGAKRPVESQSFEFRSYIHNNVNSRKPA